VVEINSAGFIIEAKGGELMGRRLKRGNRGDVRRLGSPH
jgi:hypothetical protein